MFQFKEEQEKTQIYQKWTTRFDKAGLEKAKLSWNKQVSMYEIELPEKSGFPAEYGFGKTIGDALLDLRYRIYDRQGEVPEGKMSTSNKKI